MTSRLIASPTAARATAATVATVAAALMAGCGGGGGDSPPAVQASVSTASAGPASYSQTLVVTVNGSNLDQGLRGASAGCKNIALSASAPYVSTASTAYFKCTVSAVGGQSFALTRSDGTALLNVAYTVAAPQVTLAFSNGAAVSGNVVITLEPAKAPITVDNFLAYVSSGFYVGTVIHRNSPGFVLQGGGYAGPLVANGATPVPKPTNAAITLEDNAGLSNLKWTVAMARTGVADSATSQFFVNLVDNTFLDRTATARGYAVFGTVTGGTSVVSAMAAAPCAAWVAFLGSGECLPSPNLTLTSAVQTQ